MSDTKRKTGRPSKYSDEMAEKICELIANGMSLRTVCLQEGMPSAVTVCKWLSENQEFSKQYARAREEQAVSFADEIISIADSVEPDSAAVAKAKLQIDSRKWLAAKMAPKKYGDKVEQQITGSLAIQADVKLSDLFLSDEE
ncbi:terminase small subunit-like protein [Neisseria sp.]